MINIILATDNNFVQHCCVVMASIMANNKGVSFYIFTEGLNKENENILVELVKECGEELHICLIDSAIVSHFPMPPYMSGHISIATYYRLFVEQILPKELDRILYLDCDIVVRGSLTPLWELPMNGKAIGAVYQYNEWAISNKSFDRLGYDEKYGYFNAGVLLINLCFWREHNVTDQLMLFIKENYSQIHSHDQDVLNAVLHKYVLPLNYTWNFLPSFFEKERYSYPSFVQYESVTNPVIIHFVHKPKPWQRECKHPYKNEYYKYLDLTSFKGWRPKRNWKEFKEFTLMPFIIKTLALIDFLKIRKLLKK